MTFIGFIFLLLIQFLSGWGLVQMFGAEPHRLKRTALCFAVGVALVSMVPFFLELARIPIDLTSVLAGMLLLCALVNIPGLRKWRTWSFKGMKVRWLPSFKLYEWPFMVVFALILIASVWRAYYFPPNARDVLSGPEVVAEYAVKEHTMINSVFTVDLQTTNNYQKPPFITGLQIIYKLFGFPFGQVWLSVLTLAFTVFLYQALREKVHAIIAGLMLLFFFAIPELYAYTFIILFDYPNMVFFFFAFYYLVRYLSSGKANEFYFATVLFGIASYIRLETLFFVGLLLPAIWISAAKHKFGFATTAIRSLMLLGASSLFYILWVKVFMAYYMPGQFNIKNQFNTHLSSLLPLWERFRDLNIRLLFGRLSPLLWGYYFPAFLTLLAGEIAFFRRLSRESRNWIYGITIIYLGLPVMGYLLPLVDLMHTTKRSLFKILPLMLMALANNGLLQMLSQRISSWEEKEGEEKIAAGPAVVEKKSMKNRTTR